MSWKTVRLEDICVSISDGDHQAPPKVNKGIPFITISNIDNLNKIDFSNVMYVPDNYYDGLDTKRKPQKNDILYSVVGTFGKPVYIDNDDKFVFQRHIAILRPNLEKIVPKFLYHIMLSREFYAQADTLAIGAAQRTISLTALRKMKVDIPSLEMQNKITSILAKYDDLIANNNKRIKILEQMAENLYKEWFVRFRFPGYETAEFVDGVPKDWTYIKLDEICSFCYGKMPKTEHVTKEKIGYPIFSGYNITGYYDTYMYNDTKLVLIARGVGGTGDVAMAPKKSYITNLSIIFNLNNEKLLKEYLYQRFKLNNLKYLDTGAAQSQITIENLKRVKVLIPNNNYLARFNEMVSAIQKEKVIIESQTKKIIKQRDLLLLRLMSGKLQLK